jgi:hypothetical protein
MDQGWRRGHEGVTNVKSDLVDHARPEAMTVASEPVFPLGRLVRPLAPIPILRSGDNITV